MSDLAERSSTAPAPKGSQSLLLKTNKALGNYEDYGPSNSARKYFLYARKDGTNEEVMSYNETLDYLQNKDKASAYNGTLSS